MTCSIDGCEMKAIARGWCSKHWSRWRRTGDPLGIVSFSRDPVENFLSKIDKEGPLPSHCPELGRCWQWTSRTQVTGYGRLKVGRTSILAHRFSYKTFVGPVPDELELDHLCRNRACCNPDHLEPVTHTENMQRAVPHWDRVTHCLRGHPFDEGNTYMHPSGRQVCKACKNQRQRKRRRTAR